MDEDFELVKRKGQRSSPEPKPECMILNDEEMRSQTNRMNWRKGTNFSVADLFRVQNERPEFPKIFQNYKPATKKDTPFSVIKQKTPKNTVETTLSSIRASTKYEEEFEPDYAEKTP